MENQTGPTELTATDANRRWRLLGMSALLIACIVGACSHVTEPITTSDQSATDAVSTDDASDPMLSVDTLLPAPEDFALTRIGSEDFPIPPHAKYLEGIRICIDPGHGGDAHKHGYKRGPTGVREAEMNLRVAQYLRDLLVHVGAEVKLTREGDNDLSLADRAKVADDWDADLFISCHHNATNNTEANRTTVWYHGTVDDRPDNLDLARHLCEGLFDSLQIPQLTGIPLKSDQLMYESGFGVLRAANKTAALCETSFYTNPEEEQRLRDPQYNLREAYGMFMGLARYAAGGLPTASIKPADDESPSQRAPRTLVFQLDDGLRSRNAWGSDRSMILKDSIAVRIDGERVPHEFSADTYELNITIPDRIESGEHNATVQFENMFKNANTTPNFAITVD
ncbi:MAG TPA: N-acetylmuramoyl-L-alanine amidase [Phycisphaerae bacterium]|nr:N-acetylmuramoyl-L-alanine amidase [Phycisphaerae bacterium]